MACPLPVFVINKPRRRWPSEPAPPFLEHARATDNGTASYENGGGGGGQELTGWMQRQGTGANMFARRAKRRFFRLFDGWLTCHESGDSPGVFSNLLSRRLE